MFKKLVIFISSILTLFILIGCESPVDPLDKAFDLLQIGLQDTDTIDSVREDITLPTTVDGISDLEVTWSSENEAIISLTGKVERQVSDVAVVLTAHLKLNSEERFKFFTVTVKSLDDSQAPLIHGVKDIYIDLGTEAPNYLAGIYATDNIDPNVEVTFDASNVDLNTLGAYDLTYSATDSAGNTTTTTIKVYVVDEVETPISDINTLSNGDAVKTKGSITASYKTLDKIIFYLEDSTSSIRVEADLEFDLFINIGDEVILRGSKALSHGEVVINEVRDITYLRDLNISPKAIKSNQLANNINKLVSVYGLVNEVHTFIHTTYRLETLDGSLLLVIPEGLDENTKEAIQTKLRNLELGLGITTVGVVRPHEGSHAVILTNPDMITLESNVDTQELLNVIKSRVTIPDFSGTITSNLTLLKNQDLFFGVTVTYISSNEEVLAHNGQVSLPEDDTNVDFSYTLQYGETILEAKTFNLIIQGTNRVYTGYYASLTGKTGGAILIELNNIISSYTYRSYDAARQILQETDEDPNNPNNIILIYNRASVKSTWDGGETWNREHIWPQSYLGSTHQKADLHNLKPADNGINSSRGNLSFRDSVDSSYGKVNGGWFPGDEDKGDVARILFYMVTRYTHLGLDIMGIQSELISWHIEDPVDDFERNRNEVIYSYQENRNPFIDHPELVHQIWTA